MREHTSDDSHTRRRHAEQAAGADGLSSGPAADREQTTGRLVALLSELVLALYSSGPHGAAPCRTEGEPLTSRQMEAVVFLAHHRTATMGELADGLGIGGAAASELVSRLSEKGVVARRRSEDDARVVHISLAEPAERHAQELLTAWGAHLDAAFAAYPDIDPDTLAAFLRALVGSLKGRSPA